MIRLSLLVLLGSGVSVLNVVAQSPGTFVLTGSMSTPRVEGHSATPLNDGRVLITGGYPATASAELYDPSTGTFISAGAMATPRSHHTATLLSNGQVLIAGGSLDRDLSAELYDPSTGTFTPTGDMVTADMYSQSAVLLRNGKVLISEGVFLGPPNPSGARQVLPAQPELYDPVTGMFTPAGGAKLTILGATATLLPNGQVLLAGGWKIGDTSIYDPATGSARFLSYLPIWSHNATLLKNGKVLITGGSIFTGSDRYNDYGQESLGTAQIYDPSLERFKPTGSLFEARDLHTATLLPAGLVLVAGGDLNYTSILASAELYDPASAAFTRTGGMNVSRVSHTATLLHDGRVLITGGANSYWPYVGLASAELYAPPVMAVSSASLAAPLAPESLGSLFGSGLASRTESADPLSPPTTLGGISLRVVDSSGTERLAPLFYVSPSQINFGVPAGTAPGNVALDVLNAPAQLSKTAAQVNPIAPGLFAYEDNTVVAYALRSEPSGKQTVLSVRDTIVLDKRPVYLILYATGIRNHSSAANVQCTIGGISVPVEYAGPEGSGVPGLDQANLRLVPALEGLGLANMVLTVDGISSNTVLVDIR
jgi:uncharacterized protein (TIGR03437 family)